MNTLFEIMARNIDKYNLYDHILLSEGAYFVSIPSHRLIVKFSKIKTLFKNTGTANPLINSGDAVLVVYQSCK